MPAPLLSVVPDPVSDSEDASEAKAEANEASRPEMDDNIDVLLFPCTPPVETFRVISTLCLCLSCCLLLV